jgi:hypothetical protein
MKKTFILAILFTFTFCKAQVPSSATIIPMNSMNENSFNITNNGVYFKDTDNKFGQWVGTWQYTNGNTVFKIVIQKIIGKYIPKGTFNSPINCYMDILVGGYYYKENGVVKTNHLTYTNVLQPPLRCSGAHTTPNQLTISYKEIDKRPNLSGGIVDLTFLLGSTTQATWIFDPTYRRNYSVPDNLILIKQ